MTMRETLRRLGCAATLPLLTWCVPVSGVLASSPVPTATCPGTEQPACVVPVPSGAQVAGLEDVQWVVTQVVQDGTLTTLPPAAPAATMLLWHAVAFGSGGCNAWSASYVLDGSRIVIGDVRSTDRQCLVVAPAEGPLLDALPRVAAWSIRDRMLTLADDKGAPLVVATSDIQPSVGIRGVWRIAALSDGDGRPMDPVLLGQASASFGGGQFRATVGCNWITGTYAEDGSALRIEPGSRTMMACDGLMEAEDALWDALIAVTTAMVDGDALGLGDADGIARIRLVPARGQRAQPTPSTGP